MSGAGHQSKCGNLLKRESLEQARMAIRNRYEADNLRKYMYLCREGILL